MAHTQWSQSKMKKESFNHQEISFGHRMIASCTGAIITSLVVTPLDVVKVRLQSQQKNLSTSRCFLYCNGFIEELCCRLHATGKDCMPPYWHHATEKHFSGTVDAFIKITRAEGLKSLWSGLPPTLIMAVPSTVAYFTIYEQIRDKLTYMCNATKPPIWVAAVAGGSARALAATLISPMELVRTKMQSKKLSYIEIYNSMKNLVRHQGLRSIYRGLGPTFLRDVPFSAFYWANYEQYKRSYNQETPSFWFSFAAGATAGCIAALLTLPFDVIKTHRQIELGEMEASSRRPAASTYTLMKLLYQRNGYKSLFTGVVPRIIKVAPACAIMISTYEYGKRFFHNHNSSKEHSSI